MPITPYLEAASPNSQDYGPTMLVQKCKKVLALKAIVSEAKYPA